MLPFVGWSQPTTFSDEETDFAMSVIEKKRKTLLKHLMNIF